ncbi:MAG TPA: hypothetical protein VGI29_04705 [Candidatus Binataceae bacterium]
MKTTGEERAASPDIVVDSPAAVRAAEPDASFAAADARRPTCNSLLRHSPAVVLLAILVADSNRHTDPDLWGHIRFGQAFIASRHLIHSDPYSYSAPGAPWHDYEWLAEVVMAFVYNAAGVAGLKLWKFVCTALTVIFVADSEAETGASLSTQLLVLMIAALALVLQMQLRPQMFTFVLLGALLALLARDAYRRRAPLWTAVPLMALWANLHGGWIVGIATLAMYTAGATIRDFAAGAGLRRGVRLAAVTGSALLATLLNPYGFGLWRAVAWALIAPYKRLANVEWQPMFFALAQQWHHAHSGIFVYAAVLLLMAGLAVACILAPDASDLPLVAVAAMMCIGAWLSVRNMGLVAVTASAPLARHLDLLGQKWRGGAPARSSRPVNQLVIFALCVALMLKTDVFSRRLDPDQPYPAGALAFMRSHQLSGRILNDWNWGDYLIWHAAPACKVFIDGRDDTVYPLEVVRQYLLFRFDLPNGYRILDAYPHDYVLISRSAQARQVMERRRDWKLLYRDDNALLYARASAPAASLPNLPVIGAASPVAFP